MSLFSIESLYTGYGPLPVLKGITLDIAPADFVGIIGQNGAGKSTLVRALTGILSPFSGSVLFRGTALDRYEKMELARSMAMVPQFIENLIPFTIRDFVETGRFPFRSFWKNYRHEDTAQVTEALEVTGTVHLSDRLLTELSGGELQLVSIARALAQSREIIILDEPISSLDFRHAIRIMDVLYALHKKGATIITVLHGINLASDYCSRIIGLKEGILYCDGAPETCISAETMSGLFDTTCYVEKNPVTGRPYIITYPGYVGKK